MSLQTKNGNPTIRDIAHACGVSEATVSYVINGKRVLKPETRERVWQTMRDMNYHPSAVARGLSSKRVHTLGVFLGVVNPAYFVANPYVGGLLQGVITQAQRQEFNVTLFTASWENSEVSAPPLRDGRTDGILVIAPPADTDILSGLTSLKMPLIAISAAPAPGVPVVDVDNEMGLRLATQHLIDLGHRRIAYLTGNSDLASYTPRLKGFEQTMRAAGIEPDPELVKMSSFDGSLAFEQTSSLLRRPTPPTAIIAGNDTIGASVIEAARCAGFSVPRDVSVVGFDDLPLATLVTPNLTTIHQPLAEIGAKATSLLIDSLHDPRIMEDGSLHLLPAELVVRGSTSAPSTHGRRRSS